MDIKNDFIVRKEDIPKMPIKNWVLAIIHDKDERRIRDAVTLMNEVFIFAKEILPSIEQEFEFKRTGFGPYSKTVAKSASQFLSTNILELKELDSLSPTRYGYLLTEGGAKKADKLHQMLSKPLRDRMQFMRFATNQMGPAGMLQYIHSLYPEYVYLRDGGEKVV